MRWKLRNTAKNSNPTSSTTNTIKSTDLLVLLRKRGALKTFVNVWSSPVATSGLNPPPQTKLQAPQIENMKHYKLVEFLSNLNVNPPCTNVKPSVDDFLATVGLVQDETNHNDATSVVLLTVRQGLSLDRPNCTYYSNIFTFLDCYYHRQVSSK